MKEAHNEVCENKSGVLRWDATRLERMKEVKETERWNSERFAPMDRRNHLL